MRYNNTDHLSLGHVIAIGMRQNVIDPSYEVYARLVSGMDVVIAYDGDKEEALSCLDNSRHMMARMGLRFVITQEDTYVNTLFVERVYVDSQENSWLAMAEDVTGRSYIVARDSKAECMAYAVELAMEISMLSNDPPPLPEGEFS